MKHRTVLVVAVLFCASVLMSLGACNRGTSDCRHIAHACADGFTCESTANGWVCLSGEAAAPEPEELPPDGFVRIEAGTFMMGSLASEPEFTPGMNPQHEVTLTRDF